jgi:class 3 adenylate cyclase
MQHRYEALTHTTEYSQRQFDATSLVAGISFGGVIYGAFDGTGERSTAVGRLVNLAFRLAQVAEHGQIVVSEEVQQHASAKLTAFEFTPGTLPMEAKGFEGRPYYLARAQ